jgi:ATP-dependent Clp protease ATP-binding subunit ClpA
MLRFSKKARQALAAAQRSAKQMQHPSVETSHLLLALVELADSGATNLTNVRLEPGHT